MGFVPGFGATTCPEAVRLQYVEMLAALLVQKIEQFEIEQESREDEAAEEEKERALTDGQLEQVSVPIETNKEQLVSLDCSYMSVEEVSDVDRNLIKILTESPFFFLKELNMSNFWYCGD